MADRLLKQFAAAKADFKEAEAAKNEEAAKKAKDRMNALVLFRTGRALGQLDVTHLGVICWIRSPVPHTAVFGKILPRLASESI